MFCQTVVSNIRTIGAYAVEAYPFVLVLDLCLPKRFTTPLNILEVNPAAFPRTFIVLYLPTRQAIERFAWEPQGLPNR